MTCPSNGTSTWTWTVGGDAGAVAWTMIGGCDCGFDCGFSRVCDFGRDSPDGFDDGPPPCGGVADSPRRTRTREMPVAAAEGREMPDSAPPRRSSSRQGQSRKPLHCRPTRPGAGPERKGVPSPEAASPTAGLAWGLGRGTPFREGLGTEIPFQVDPGTETPDHASEGEETHADPSYRDSRRAPLAQSTTLQCLSSVLRSC